MIVFEDLSKIYRTRGGGQKVVLSQINLTIPSRASVGVLGRNGAGKSTLLNLVGGVTDPTYGRILTDGLISFPVGFSGSFHKDMTGAQNCRFVARIYGVDTEALIDFVEDFAQLGPHFHMPLRTYSSGMGARLSFGVSMGLKFDFYLIDEATSVGDAAFKAKSRQLFLDRVSNAGALFVTHSLGMMRELCDSGMVLEDGKLTYYDDLEEAIAHHAFNQVKR